MSTDYLMNNDTTKPAASLPRRVPAKNAYAWLTQGVRVFIRQPLLWIMFCLASFVLTVVVACVLPLLSVPATFFVQQALMGGFFFSVCKAERDEVVEIGDLFFAFRCYWQPFLLLTVLYLAILALAAVGLMVLMLSVGIGVTAEHTFKILENFISSGMIRPVGAGLISGIVLLSLTLLIFGIYSAFYFTPALIVFAQQKPFAAMKTSFFAIVMNWRAFFFLIVLAGLLLFLGALPLMLGWVIVIPVLMLTNYAAWKDIFVKQRIS